MIMKVSGQTFIKDGNDTTLIRQGNLNRYGK
jgi:hypothetical protein